MWGKVGVAVAAAAIIMLTAFLALLASGPPGAPGAAISTAPNPSAATSYQVTVEYEERSLLTPSFFGWNGQAAVLSAWWTWNGGTRNVIEQSQHMVTSVLSSSGDVYTLGTTFTFDIGAQCAASVSCAGDALNVTVQVFGINPMGALWSSASGPSATFTFSNIAGYSQLDGVVSPPAVTGAVSFAPGAAPTAAYLFELFAPLTIAGATLLLAVTYFRPNAYTAIAGALGVVALGAELLVWVVL